MTGDPQSRRARAFAILGDPVGHSLSPAMQNAAMRHENLDGVYTAIRCDAASLGRRMADLASAGGGGNVTLPHKERAAALLDEPSDAVRGTGACNTFWGRDGRLHGDNTDVVGFASALGTLPGRVGQGRILILGAGGAAAAVLAALAANDHVVVIHLHNRSPERAEALARRIGDPRIRVSASLEDVLAGPVDLVVNATSLGLRDDDPLPTPPDVLASVSAVLDLVYAPTGTTRWVETARAAGLPAIDGIEMLVHQGAASFRRWWGIAAPLEVMRDAALRARGA